MTRCNLRISHRLADAATKAPNFAYAVSHRRDMRHLMMGRRRALALKRNKYLQADTKLITTPIWSDIYIIYIYMTFNTLPTTLMEQDDRGLNRSSSLHIYIYIYIYVCSQPDAGTQLPHAAEQLRTLHVKCLLSLRSCVDEPTLKNTWALEQKRSQP